MFNNEPIPQVIQKLSIARTMTQVLSAIKSGNHSLFATNDYSKIVIVTNNMKWSVDIYLSGSLKLEYDGCKVHCDTRLEKATESELELFKSYIDSLPEMFDLSSDNGYTYGKVKGERYIITDNLNKMILIEQ